MKVMYRGNKKFGFVIVSHNGFEDFIERFKDCVKESVANDETVDIVDTESEFIDKGQHYKTIVKYAILGHRQ